MENYNIYIPQIETLISSGIRENIELGMEIAKSMGLYDKIMAPWLMVWEYVKGYNEKNLSDIEILCKCSNEYYLTIFGHHVNEIPSAVFLMQKLKYLTIKETRLKEFPLRLTELINLQSIDFSKNQLKNVPAEILQMPSLVAIDLSKNLLKELPDLGMNIQYLSIASNKFKKTPQALLNKNGLKALNVSNNTGFVWDLSSFDINNLYFFSGTNSEYIADNFLKNSKLSTWFNEKNEIVWVFGSNNHFIESNVYFSTELRQKSFCIYDDFDDYIFWKPTFLGPVDYEEDEYADYIEDLSHKQNGRFKMKFPTGKYNFIFC